MGAFFLSTPSRVCLIIGVTRVWRSRLTVFTTRVEIGDTRESSSGVRPTTFTWKYYKHYRINKACRI